MTKQEQLAALADELDKGCTFREGKTEYMQGCLAEGHSIAYKLRAILAAPPQKPQEARLQEVIRERMRLYDSQVNVDCIGTGYDVTDIITISELETLVGFTRDPGAPGGET